MKAPRPIRTTLTDADRQRMQRARANPGPYQPMGSLRAKETDAALGLQQRPQCPACHRRMHVRHKFTEFFWACSRCPITKSIDREKFEAFLQQRSA